MPFWSAWRLAHPNPEVPSGDGVHGSIPNPNTSPNPILVPLCGVAVDRFRTTLQRRLQERHLAVSEGLLLSLDFTSLFHYLHLLRLIATSMRVGGKRALFYLAAAVSDFYVPWEAMVRPTQQGHEATRYDIELHRDGDGGGDGMAG